jgi:hypothetical protein
MPDTLTVTDGATVTTASPSQSPLTQTEAPSLEQLTDDVGWLNNRVKLLHDDTSELHLDVLMAEWQKRTSDLVRLEMRTLLGRLADLGFAWRDIARLIGVSVPAVQKWRQGSAAKGESRTSAAAIVAACEMISEHYLVQDVASWFESPVLFGYPVTPLDIYSARIVDKVFLLASGNADPESVLASFDPNWRENYRNEFVVVQTDDGLSLRPRD